MIYNRPEIIERLYLVSLRAAAKRLALSEREAKLVLDACNGLWLTGDLMGQHLRAEVHDAIDLNRLDEKWAVDGRSLVSRLRDLPLPLTAAVEIWIADFWSSEKLNDETWERDHLALVVQS